MTSTIQLKEQLSTFEIIKSIFLTNPQLNLKFTADQYYEYQPKVKELGSNQFLKYPYILIEVPTVEDLQQFLGDANVLSESLFTVTITLKVEYTARDKIRLYSNQILKSLRESVQTLRSNGYEYMSCNISLTPEPFLESQKAIYETQFELTLRGEVQ